MAFGLRVVRDDGGPIGFRHALIRGLVGVVELWLLSGAPALICSLANSKGKRLGDLLAGTVVVRERMPSQSGVVAAMPPGLAGWAAGLDLSRLPDDLALAARSTSRAPASSCRRRGMRWAPGSRMPSPPPSALPRRRACRRTSTSARCSPSGATARPPGSSVARGCGGPGPQPGAPAYGSSPYGPPGYASPQYGPPQYGQPYGQPQYGQPQYGAPAYGQPQYTAPQHPDQAQQQSQRPAPGEARPDEASRSPFAPPS
jgi:hypothetical protein